MSIELKPCVSCGTMVPEYDPYPYTACGPDCELSNQWRREAQENEKYKARCERLKKLLADAEDKLRQMRDEADRD